ncbi:MAG: hypothetical protein NVSMB6_30870 [Burkholderiaceae bacterium]
MQEIIGALDIGGTKIAATIAAAGGPLARVTGPTARTGAVDALPLQALDLLTAACRKAGVPMSALNAVGVSSAGPFKRLDNKIAVASPNICGGADGCAHLPNDWTAVPLESVLDQHFDRVEIQNDCVAALLGERTFGAVADEPNCVYVTWSTGVGFGLCVDGQLLTGKHGNAGHAGHMLMDPDSSAQCGCGNYGDLESLISGVHIATGSGMATPELFAAARDGNPGALARVTTAAVWFGRGLYNLAATLDTRVFVIGGSVWQHHGHWLAPIVRHEIETRFATLTDGVILVAPGLDRYVADVGALCLVMPEPWQAVWQASQPWRRLDAVSV